MTRSTDRCTIRSSSYHPPIHSFRFKNCIQIRSESNQAVCDHSLKQPNWVNGREEYNSVGKVPYEMGARFPGAYEPNEAENHLHGRNSDDICGKTLLFMGTALRRNEAGNSEVSMANELGGHFNGESVQLEKIGQYELVLHSGGNERTLFRSNSTCTPDAKNSPGVASRSLDDYNGNGERATSMVGHIPPDDAFMLFLNDPREDGGPYGVVGQDSLRRYG